jgi:hypothetical protein
MKYRITKSEVMVPYYSVLHRKWVWTKFNIVMPVSGDD